MTNPIIRVPSNMQGPAFMADGTMSDGLVNFVSRLGTGADKSSHYQYLMDIYNGHDMEAAYRTSSFRKVVDIPPEDEVREWRSWKGAKPKQITAIDDEEKRLDYRRKVREARTLSRKDGASAWLLGTGGDASKPLDPATIAKGGLKYLTVCTRFDITPSTRDNDPESPTFNEPEYWLLRNSSGTRVHPSRVVKFIGNPIRTLGYWDGWNGESLWTLMRRAIVNIDQISGGIAAMVDEAKLDVIKLKNFMANIITQEGENNLVKRFGAMGTLKSITNAVIIDGDDEYEQKTLDFAGLPDVWDRAAMVVAALADIPETRMWGRAPQGMNATGTSDMRNYYDRIKSGQTVDITPTINPADECLIRSALGGRPKEITYEWNPLYQQSEKEAAEVEKIFAETAASYANAALIPDMALAGMVKGGIIERGQWPDAEKSFSEAEAAGDEPGLLSEPTEAEQAEEEARVALAMQTVKDPAGPGPQKPRLVATKDVRFTDARPRTLYVRRDVVNVAEITKWARSQGFTDILPDLHVTIISSRLPLDWMAMGSSWQAKLEVPVGGPRIVDVLGTTSPFFVLLFASDELINRHDRAKEAGASWDFPEFQPHISIQKGGEIDIEKVEPYRGKILLGAEIFEERKPD